MGMAGGLCLVTLGKIKRSPSLITVAAEEVGIKEGRGQGRER